MEYFSPSQWQICLHFNLSNLTLLCLCVFERQKHRERDKVLSYPDSLPKCPQEPRLGIDAGEQGWGQSQQEPRIQFKSSGRWLSDLSHHCCLPGSALLRSRSQELELGLRPRLHLYAAVWDRHPKTTPLLHLSGPFITTAWVGLSHTTLSTIHCSDEKQIRKAVSFTTTTKNNQLIRLPRDNLNQGSESSLPRNV